MPLPLPLLQSPRLQLRLGRPEDALAMLAFYEANAAFLAPFEPIRPPEFYTESYWRERFTRNHEDFQARRALHLVLFDGPEAIGTAHFNGIVLGAAWYCYLGYSLAEHRQGQGLMHEALALALPYVFGPPLGLHRVQANYMPHNRRSGALLRRLGFVVEGYARDYLRLNGRWEDHVLTSLTHAAWEPQA